MKCTVMKNIKQESIIDKSTFHWDVKRNLCYLYDYGYIYLTRFN